MICCPLSQADDVASGGTRTTPKARKQHRCCECRETIEVGASYERQTLFWDGTAGTFKTCLSCAEIRDHFSCQDGSGVLEELWNDLEENFFPGMVAGGPCMEGLSPEAKGRLFERRMKWLLEQDS